MICLNNSVQNIYDIVFILLYEFDFYIKPCARVNINRRIILHTDITYTTVRFFFVRRRLVNRQYGSVCCILSWTPSTWKIWQIKAFKNNTLFFNKITQITCIKLIQIYNNKNINFNYKNKAMPRTSRNMIYSELKSR